MKRWSSPPPQEDEMSRLPGARPDGTPMGCADSGPPEEYTEQALSRGADVAAAIRALAPLIMADGSESFDQHWADETIKMILPPRMRFEMTWTKWTYRSRR